MAMIEWGENTLLFVVYGRISNLKWDVNCDTVKWVLLSDNFVQEVCEKFKISDWLRLFVSMIKYLSKWALAYTKLFNLSLS